MPPLGPIVSPLLVGRDDALDLADRRVAEALAGRGQLLMLAGDAGIGKSRLLSAMLRKAAAAGFRISKGDLAPQDREVPLSSVLDLARTMRGDAAFGTLGQELLAIRAGDAGDNLGSRRMLVHEIVDRLLASIDRPTVLAFEDLQWADELSLEVVGELARLGRDRPLLLLAAYRLGELPLGSNHREWRSRLLSQRLAEEVRLRSLTLDETALVVTLIAGNGLPAPRDVVKAVYERTEGVPLYVEELLAVLGDVTSADGRSIRDLHVPDTIEDTVLSRAERLSPEARAVARAGAVIGRCFIPEVVAGCLDRSVADLETPIDELIEHGFLYPFNFVDRGYYDFRHQLLRDVVYGTVPPTELRQLHARAAEFTLLLEGASEIHASAHFERAGLGAQAYRAALAGAQAASAISSRREAFELYTRAVANVPDGLPADELARLYEGYLEAAFAVDDVPAGIVAARTARRYRLESGDGVAAAEHLVSLAGMYRRDVRPTAERLVLLEEARAELLALPATPDRDFVLSDVFTFEAMIALDAGRHADATALFAQARAARATSSDTETGDIDFVEAHHHVVLGDPRGIETMLRVAREGHDQRQEGTRVTAYRTAAAAAVRLMDYATAATGLDEGLRYADEIEQSYCRHVMAATSAHLAWASGRWDDAVPIAAIEIVEKGSRRGTLGSRDALGYVAFGRGDVTRAREVLEDSLRIGRASQEIELVLPPLWGLAETELVAGDAVAAAAHCAEALTLARATHERALLVPFVVTGTRAHLAALRPDAAEGWLRETSAHLVGWTWLAKPALDHAGGLVRLAHGATGIARSELESAVAGWDALGRIWEATWARIDLARCLLRINRTADAQALLAEATATAERLGSTPLRDAAEDVRRAARGRGTTDEPWAPLTAREFEVARLIAAGHTNAEIAEALAIAPKTASAHVEHILAKLGLGRRAEVAAWATMVAGAAGQAAPTIGRTVVATH